MRIGEATNRDDLIAALDYARQERINGRRGFEYMWWNNLALVGGDHFSTWNPRTARFEDRDPLWETGSGDRTDRKPRLVINHALTVARTELAKLTKSRPAMDIIANSDEQVDVSATKVGLAALDYAEWKFKLPKHRRTALWWMIQTGLGAIYVGWDPLDSTQQITYTIDPTTGEAVFNPERKREIDQQVKDGVLDEGDVQTETFPLGEVCYKVFSPFQLLPDPACLEFEDLKELITTEVVNVDVVKGIYGRAARNVQPTSNLAMGTIETRMLTRAGIPGTTSWSQQKPVDDGVEVHTWWCLPNYFRGNSFLRDGVMVRWTSGRIELDFTPTFPYNDGRMPFAFFEHIPNATSIWPDSVITHIRGPNLEIDKTVSQLIENKDYMANPMWLIATQHRVKGNVRNVAGAIVRYRHVPQVPPPAPVPGMQMPAQVENLVVALREQIMDISGQSEVARGRVPSGVRSGVAVAYLQEEDDTKIAPTVQTMEDAIAIMGSLTLERFSQYYDFERILRFYRRDGSFDVRKFKGADLANNTDVVCQAGSAMPKSKASKQQYTLELVSLGIETDPRKIRDMLELGEGEPDDVDKSIAQADRENSMMLYGVDESQTRGTGEQSFKRLTAAIPVKAWQNHEVHIQRHTSRMMDEDFEKLSITNPDIPNIFDQHVAMHYQEIAKAQQQQAAALMAAKGAPDGPPTPAGGADQGGFSPNTNVTRADIPDVIGRGVVSNSTRQIRPQQ